MQILKEKWFGKINGVNNIRSSFYLNHFVYLVNFPPVGVIEEIYCIATPEGFNIEIHTIDSSYGGAPCNKIINTDFTDGGSWKRNPI